MTMRKGWYMTKCFSCIDKRLKPSVSVSIHRQLFETRTRPFLFAPHAAGRGHSDQMTRCSIPPKVIDRVRVGSAWETELRPAAAKLLRTPREVVAAATACGAATDCPARRSAGSTSRRSSRPRTTHRGRPEAASPREQELQQLEIYQLEIELEARFSACLYILRARPTRLRKSCSLSTCRLWSNRQSDVRKD